MREAFALQKLLTFFSTKNIGIFEKLTSENNETLTNDVVSFEQPGPDLLAFYLSCLFMFKGRFLLFQVYNNFANLFSKLSVSTFYKEVSKFQLNIHT